MNQTIINSINPDNFNLENYSLSDEILISQNEIRNISPLALFLIQNREIGFNWR